jgi:N-glycosyltransferase
MIYVSLGSLLTRTPGFATRTADILTRIAQGLAELDDLNVVMATGPTRYNYLTQALGHLPHLLLLRHAPQTLILRSAIAFVTHFGFASLREALDAGVLMLGVPLTTDQPGNAHQLQRLGLAVVLGPHARPGDFRNAVKGVLASPTRRETAREWQRAMHAQPPLQDVLPRAYADAVRLVCKDGRDLRPLAHLPLAQLDPPDLPGQGL